MEDEKQYGKMTRKELYLEAKAKGFRGTSRYKKAQLLDLLLDRAPSPPEKKAAPAARDEGAVEPPAAEKQVVDTAPPPAPSAETREPSAGPREPRDVYVDWGYPLPENYGLDVIGAAAKDPNWIFVYWDLSGKRREEVAQSHGREIFSLSRWHLRVTETASGGTVDFPVNLDSRNSYVPVSEDRAFRIQIGLLTPEGEFIEFAVSRDIRTPRSRPSDNISEQWMVADELFQRFLRQAGAPGASELSSRELADRIKDDLAK